MWALYNYHSPTAVKWVGSPGAVFFFLFLFSLRHLKWTSSLSLSLSLSVSLSSFSSRAQHEAASSEFSLFEPKMREKMLNLLLRKLLILFFTRFHSALSQMPWQRISSSYKFPQICSASIGTFNSEYNAVNSTRLILVEPPVHPRLL